MIDNKNLIEMMGRCVKQGKVYDLGVPLQNFMVHAPLHPPYIFSQVAMHGDYVFGPDGASAANDLIVMCSHDGTHLDALGHISKNGKLHGGIDVREAQHGQLGLTQLGIDKVDPVVRRGVLIDVAGYKGVDILPAGYGITSDDLKETLESQGVTLDAGDVVLVRTGWMNHFEDKEEYVGHKNGCPGVTLDGAQWLAKKEIFQTGTDTLAYEVWPSADLAVHVFLIVDQGIAIMEMLYLEEMAKEKVYEFAFISLPLKIVGGTASPIRPIAIC